MYCRYPSLIRELTSSLSRALASDPGQAYELLRTIIDELESEQHLMEALFHELLRRSRDNDEGLRNKLYQACRETDPAAIRDSFSHWEASRTDVREVIEQVVLLFHRGLLVRTDQDQEPVLND